jgi:D-alanyl-D-alanine carboxypeptidase
MRLLYLRLMIATTMVALVLAACGGGNQLSETAGQEAKPVPNTPAETSADPDLDRRFKEAVDNYVESKWGTWILGASIGQCLVTNAALMTKEAREGVIEHGIEEAFDKLSGPHLSSLSKVWDLCESNAKTTSTSSSAKTPSSTTSKPAIDPTPPVGRVLNFETSVGHRDFSDSLQEQFRSAVDEHFDAATEKAGVSVAVYQDGYLWRYAKGNASSSAEMTVGTPTLIRSTSKTFLAGLVLQQIGEGLYSLSDTLDSVLSGNKDYEALDKNVINPDVTVEQILTMTSGIQDITDYSRSEYTALQESQNWRPVDIVRLVIADFVQPGTYQYSNTNSMLLGLIAEHAGQRQLNELYRSVFFDPLGIVAVLLPQDNPPPNTARPHGDRSVWGGTGFGDITESSYHGAAWYQATGKSTWAAAGMITTPENMARWAYELLSDQGSALAPTARASLLDSFTGPLISIGGIEPEHRYGYHVTRTILSLSGRSVTAYGHPGAGGGYTSNFFYSPELDMSISLLVNSHSDARSRAEGQGKIGHRTLGDIAQQIFEAYESQS